VRDQFEADGINVLVDTKATAVEIDANGDKILLCEQGSQTSRLPFDEIIVAVGRKANTKGFGLEELGIRLRPNGTIDTLAMSPGRISLPTRRHIRRGTQQSTPCSAHLRSFARTIALSPGQHSQTLK